MDEITIMIIVFFVLTFIGVPIAIAIGLSAMLAMFLDGSPLELMADMAYTSIDNFTLIAVPCFILAGLLMQKGGLAKGITDFAKVIVGHLTGGLGAVSIAACAFFAALTGSGPATTAAIGSIMVPAMKDDGYPAGYAGAVVACSGGLGVIIPPSIPLILYGVVAEVSISDLFLAAIIPGILIALFLGAANYFYIKRNGERIKIYQNDLSFKNFIKAFYNAKWAILAPVIILGGIYGGIFTPTEASVVAIIYSLFVGIFINKALNPSDIIDAVSHSAKLTGIAFLIVFTTMMFGEILTLKNIPQQLASTLLNMTQSKFIISAIIIGFIFFTGMFMGIIPMIALLVPILIPIVESIDMNLIHFGIIFVVAGEIGFETPPVGATLYIAVPIAESSIEEVSKYAIWFIIAEVIGLIIITFFPWISLVLI